ncbi:MAG: hypothetical protein H7Z37_02375, partial [Pyrinomonadaceae bacterium]|nr:hypothetical protein [Pyrinomonadaceae bacterium]
MKNLKIRVQLILLVGLVFTFAFGFSVFAWKRQPVSFCTVIEYRSRYQLIKGDNYVNLKGYIYGGNTLSFVDAKQNSCEEIGAEVVIADERKLSDESQELIR